jgi:hypothetical protein
MEVYQAEGDPGLDIPVHETAKSALLGCYNLFLKHSNAKIYFTGFRCEQIQNTNNTKNLKINCSSIPHWQ